MKAFENNMSCKCPFVFLKKSEMSSESDFVKTPSSSDTRLVCPYSLLLPRLPHQWPRQALETGKYSLGAKPSREAWSLASSHKVTSEILVQAFEGCVCVCLCLWSLPSPAQALSSP